jgi:hypothetical protein
MTGGGSGGGADGVASGGGGGGAGDIMGCVGVAGRGTGGEV